MVYSHHLFYFGKLWLFGHQQWKYQYCHFLGNLVASDLENESKKKNSSMYTHIKKFVSADFLGITYLLVQNKFSCVQYIFISFKAKRLFDLILIEKFCISYQAYNNPRIRRLSNTNCMIDHLFDICSYIPCHYLYIELLKSQITNCHMQ